MGLDLAEGWGGGGRFRYHSLGKGMASPQGEPVQLRTQQVCHLPPPADTASPVEFQGVERQTRELGGGSDY